MNLRPIGLTAAALVCLLGYRPAPGMAREDVVALRAYRPNHFFVMHHDFTGRADALKSPQDIRDTRVEIVQGLADPKCVSLRAVSPPDHYYKQAYFRIVLAKRLDERRFREDATFCIQSGLEKARLAEFSAISMRSYNFPNRFIRHRHGELWLDPLADTTDYRSSATFFIVPAAHKAQ